MTNKSMIIVKELIEYARNNSDKYIETKKYIIPKGIESIKEYIKEKQ